MPDVNGAVIATTQAAQLAQAEAEMDRDYLTALADLDPDLPGVVFGLWNVAP